MTVFRKRIVVSFGALAALLSIAGLLMLALVVLPGSSVEALADLPAGAQGVNGAESEERQARVDAVIESKADSIADMDALVLDGEPLTHEQAQLIASGGRSNYRKAASFVDQGEVLPSGCEIIALTVAMNAEGFDVSPNDIADNYVRTGTNVATEYLGSPYSDGGGLPPCIVDAANGWLDDQGASAQAYNLTGSTFEGLVQLVSMGYPVVVWTTENLGEPTFVREVRDGLQWYVSEHCVVLYGAQGDEVLVSDSLEGMSRYDRNQFGHIYEACGNKAMFILPE